MKRLFLTAALFAIVLSQTAIAQSRVQPYSESGTLTAVQPIAQPAAPSPLSPILTDYYRVKDALVAGDAKAAATAAHKMLNTINAIDKQTLSQKDRQAFITLQDRLAYDTRHISESTDIGHQREHFTSLSANLFTLAKQAHLSQQPIYADYCPMKKAYWLSSEAVIKNPYFGQRMPDCGKVSKILE